MLGAAPLAAVVPKVSAPVAEAVTVIPPPTQGLSFYGVSTLNSTCVSQIYALSSNCTEPYDQCICYVCSYIKRGWAEPGKLTDG